MNIDLRSVLNSKDFKLLMTMDCEGYNFDKNLRENVLNLERFLYRNTEAGVTTVLFTTPHFANMMYDLKLIEKVKNLYNVVFGLHIHPNDFPDEIQQHCSFAAKEEDLIGAYNYEQQLLMIKHSMNYLNDRGITNLQAYRGGYFSMNDDTSKALKACTNIDFESHNIYRSQYAISDKLLNPFPVYAFDENEEFRLEYFDSNKLIQMLNGAVKRTNKLIGITHSYLLKDDEIHNKMSDLIAELKRLSLPKEDDCAITG
jgi:hypothetical protein